MVNGSVTEYYSVTLPFLFGKFCDDLPAKYGEDIALFCAEVDSVLNAPVDGNVWTV